MGRKLGFLSPVFWWSKSRSLCHNSVAGPVPCNIHTEASHRRIQLAPSVAGSCTGASHGTARWLLLCLAPVQSTVDRTGAGYRRSNMAPSVAGCCPIPCKSDSSLATVRSTVDRTAAWLQSDPPWIEQQPGYCPIGGESDSSLPIHSGSDSSQATVHFAAKRT